MQHNLKSLYDFSREIYADWPNVNVSNRQAAMYLFAFSNYHMLRDHYVAGPIASCVRGILVHAGGWRGETARQIKAELWELLDEYDNPIVPSIKPTYDEHNELLPMVAWTRR